MLKYIDDKDLEIVNVSSKDRLTLVGTSKGNQIKWNNQNRYIKLSTGDCYEDVSEVLVSYMLKFTNIENYVEYYPCMIVEDGVAQGVGCYSYSYLEQGEKTISFTKIAKSLGLSLNKLSFDVVRDEFSDVVGFDLKFYIGKCLCVDAIAYNEDRHFNNLAVIKTPNGYREAPVYDNGLACMSDVYCFPLSKPLELNIKSVYAKPFNTDFGRQITDNFITPILLDSEAFLKDIYMVTEEEKRALEVIKYGLKKWKGVAWEEF